MFLWLYFMGVPVGLSARTAYNCKKACSVEQVVLHSEPIRNEDPSVIKICGKIDAFGFRGMV
jgi:hypothetical protein